MSRTKRFLAGLIAAFLFAAPALAACPFTFNPGDKGVNSTLSGGNLTDTGTTTADSTARATGSLTAGGKFFWSYAVATIDTARPGVGIANATANLATFLGQDFNSIGYQPSGTVLINSAVFATLASYTAPATIDVAVDLTNSKIWFRPNGGNWNNSGSDNPATNTGGLSLATLNAGPYFPAAYVSNTSALTANFGASAFTYAAPSGFVSPSSSAGCRAGGLFFMGPF
jgi:hypothetical protein